MRRMNLHNIIKINLMCKIILHIKNQKWEYVQCGGAQYAFKKRSIP